MIKICLQSFTQLLEIRATFQILWSLLPSRNTTLLLIPTGQRDVSVSTCGHVSHTPLENRMPLIYSILPENVLKLHVIF